MKFDGRSKINRKILTWVFFAIVFVVVIVTICIEPRLVIEKKVEVDGSVTVHIKWANIVGIVLGMGLTWFLLR
jgi:hypothetical protein